MARLGTGGRGGRSDCTTRAGVGPARPRSRNLVPPKVPFLSGDADDVAVRHGILDPGVAFLQNVLVRYAKG